MEKNDLIPLTLFCEQHSVELSFVQTLGDYGLVRIIVAEEQLYIEPEELAKLEQCSRLYYELEINPPGIDAIHHLLSRLQILQEENRRLLSRLRLYETD